MDTNIPQSTTQHTLNFEDLSEQPAKDLIPQQPYPLKFCSGCNQHKFATTKFFWSDRTKADQLYTLCKECVSPEGKARRDREKALNAPPEGFRKCTACDDIKPATTEYFDLRDAKRGTLHNECKPCKAERWQKHLRKSPGYWHNMYQMDAEHHKARAREYNRQHPEECKIRNHNRRARIKAAPGTYTPAQIADQLKRQKHKCYYAACGHARFKKVKGKYIYHIDHVIPITRDYALNSIDNLVLACPSCNMRKSNRLPHEWPEGGRLL